MIYGTQYAYFDLDGTLVPENGLISKRTVMAIKYLQSKGIKVGLATGRSLFFTKPFSRLINFDLPYVCINGATVYDTKFNLLDEIVFPKNAYAIFDLLAKQKIDFLIYNRQGVFFNNENHPFKIRLENMKEILNIKESFKFAFVSDWNFYKSTEFYKILVYFKDDAQKEELKSFFKVFKEITSVSSRGNILDIFNAKADKAFGIKFVFEKMKQKTDRLVVFGDNENDVKMLQMVFNSVVLNNADIKIQAYATWKTDLNCEQEGVADFIFKNF